MTSYDVIIFRKMLKADNDQGMKTQDDIVICSNYRF